MDGKAFNDQDILDNFDDEDIFFDDFLLSDFANVDSFFGDETTSIIRSDTDQSSIRRQQHQAKKSKLKKRKFDEIAADDPRKQFTDITVAAVGLGDERKIREVFDTHYTSDCAFILRFTKDTPELPNHREIHGRDKMIDFIMNVIEICPDCVLKVVGRQLNIYKDGSSYLVAKLNFTGSWLLVAALQLFEPTLENSSTNHLSSVPANVLPKSYLEQSSNGSATAAAAAMAATEFAVDRPPSPASANSVSSVSTLGTTTQAPSSGQSVTINSNSKFSSSIFQMPFPVVPVLNKPQRKRIHIAVSNVSHINAQGQIFKVDTYMKADIADDVDSSDDDD